MDANKDIPEEEVKLDEVTIDKKPIDKKKNKPKQKNSRSKNSKNSKGQKRSRPRGQNPNTIKASYKSSFKPKINSITVKPSPTINDKELHSLDIYPDLAMDLNLIPITDFAADITLSPSLPSRLLITLIPQIAQRMEDSNLSQFVIYRSCSILEANAYFQCAAQLYYSLTESQKSEFGDVYKLLQTEVSLPKSLCNAIRIIGNFDTSHGPMRIENYRHLVYTWIFHGIKCISEDGDISLLNDLHVQPSDCILTDLLVQEHGKADAKLIVDQINAVTISDNEDFYVGNKLSLADLRIKATQY